MMFFTTNNIKTHNLDIISNTELLVMRNVLKVSLVQNYMSARTRRICVFDELVTDLFL